LGNTKPATIGMVEALDTRCKEDDFIHAVKGVSMKKSKLKGKVLPKL
jgi:hypothetical protein